MKMYYYGAFPENFKFWPKLEEMPCVDSAGMAAMKYKGRVCVRSAAGEWEMLGSHSVFGRVSYWVRLQSDNPEWRSSQFLEKVFKERYPAALISYLEMTTQERQQDLALPVLEKDAAQVMQTARLQQSKWAKAIKALAGNRCFVTGSSVALEAAHIKPYCECTPAEAVSLENGVCLTASIHTMFDSGEEPAKDDPIWKMINRARWGELKAKRK